MPRAKLPQKDFQWTPKLAYAVGLLVTDGNLSKDGRHINMRSAEVKQLKTFAGCLDLKNKIGHTHGDRAYRIQFSNVQLYNWFLKIGLFPAKTYTIGKINVPDQYFRDFLRGHLDGDGSIFTYIDHYNTYRGRTYTNQRIFTRFISASKTHLVWLQQQIMKLTAVNGALIRRTPRTGRQVMMYELKFAKKESLELLRWIYYKPNLPCLERKRKRALETINIITHTKRRPYRLVSARK